MKYYSAIKKQRDPTICDNMDGPWGDYTKSKSKTDKNKYTNDLIYMWNLEQTSQEKWPDLWLPEAGVGPVGGVYWRKVMKRYKLPFAR